MKNIIAVLKGVHFVHKNKEANEITDALAKEVSNGGDMVHVDVRKEFFNSLTTWRILS